MSQCGQEIYDLSVIKSAVNQMANETFRGFFMPFMKSFMKSACLLRHFPMAVSHQDIYHKDTFSGIGMATNQDWDMEDAEQILAAFCSQYSGLLGINIAGFVSWVDSKDCCAMTLHGKLVSQMVIGVFLHCSFLNNFSHDWATQKKVTID